MKYLLKSTNKSFTPTHSDKPFNLKELYILLGMVIINSIVQFPSMDDFFGKTGFSFSYEGSEWALSQHRYERLIANLDFEELKLRDMVCEEFRKHCIPRTFIVVDESRVKAKHLVSSPPNLSPSTPTN